MKVYFTASLRGKKDFAGNYQKIVRSLEKLGHKVFSEHILNNEFSMVENQNQEEARGKYSKLLTEIKKADVFVAEVSTQSLSVGHELTEAMSLNKPIIILFTEDNRPGLLFGSSYDKMRIWSYSPETVDEVLTEAVDEAIKFSDVRFNFFVSPKILTYLDWVAQKRMVPRSVFLRDLIEKEMKKDKGFKES